NSLTIEKIDAAYGAVRVLEDVSLKVNSGETVVLLGTNGNGKSTLMKCVMGIVRPRAGAIVVEIDGERYDLIGRSTEQIVDLGIALVPEGRRLFPRLTVEENLLLGAFRHKARTALKSNLDFCFECFPRLAERRAQLAGSLSGGEQQMLALARALMLAPRILLIDEPSVGLAPVLVSRTIDKIKELKDQYKLTVLMAEQNFPQALRIADRGYVIVHGQIAFEGRSADELNNNELIRKFYLGLGSPPASPRLFAGRGTPRLLRLFVRVDHLARLVLRRRHHDLRRDVLELPDVVALDVLELDLQHARLRPFALGAEFHVADHGLEGAGADVVAELGIIEALGPFDRLRQHLQLGVAPRRHVIAERIDAFGPRTGLVALDEVGDPGELHLRHRQPEVVGDETVEQRAELRLDGGRLQAHHAAADHLRLEADFVDRAHHADGVGWIGV